MRVLTWTGQKRKGRRALVQEIERDLEGNVERRKLLGAEAANVVSEGGLGKADQAVAVDRAGVLQAFRLADRHLGC